MPALRVATVWGETVLDTRVVDAGRGYGFGDPNGVAKPDGFKIPDLPIVGVRRGWEIDPSGTVGGTLRLGGKEIDPVAVGREKRKAKLKIGKGDYGLLQYGQLSIFFQPFEIAPPAPPSPSSWTALGLFAGVAAIALHGGLGGLAWFVSAPESPMASAATFVPPLVFRHPATEIFAKMAKVPVRIDPGVVPPDVAIDDGAAAAIAKGLSKIERTAVTAPTASGGLSADAVLAVANANVGAIDACLAGRRAYVEGSFTIDPTGAPSAIAVSGEGNPAICAKIVIGRWRFPTAAKPSTVTGLRFSRVK